MEPLMTANGQDLCFIPNLKQHLVQHRGLRYNMRSLFQSWHGENSHLISPNTTFYSTQVTWRVRISKHWYGPALHRFRRRLEENSTSGHGSGPAEHLAVIIPIADSHVLQSRLNEGMLIYIHPQEHYRALTLTNHGSNGF